MSDWGFNEQSCLRPSALGCIKVPSGAGKTGVSDKMTDTSPLPWAHARRHPRTSVSFPVEVLSYSAGDTTEDEGRLIVLGAGGAFLELDGSYGLGSLLRLAFALPPTPGKITCTGIVRCRLPKGVGVEFSQLESRDRDRINRFVTRNLGG